MNLDPQQNKVGDIEPDSPKEITPGNLPQQTPEDGDFRMHQDLSESVQEPEAERGLPTDLSTRKISTMSKVIVLVVLLFAVGFVVAGLMRYGGVFFKKEKTVEKADIAIVAPKKFDDEQQRILLETTASEPVIEAASTPIAESQPASADSATAQTMPLVVSEPAAPAVDLRLESELMIPVNRSNATAAAPGSSDTATDSGGFGGTDERPSEGGSGSGQQGLAGRLNTTVFASTAAQQRGSRDYLLSRGTGIQCTLLTRIVTTYPGLTKCQVTNDVYSANGKTLLVEKGTVVLGEQQSALLQGQARVFAAWGTLETPSGVVVNIDSLGADPLGGSGHPARVNTHFWKRFGGSIMLSLIDDVAGYASSRRSNGNNNVTFDSTTQSAQDMASFTLQTSINLPLPGYVNQGERIMIFVARDVDFSNVYELVNAH